MTHLSVELTFDTASFMLTPESTGFKKDQQQKDSATSATTGSIVHPETEEFSALTERTLLSELAKMYLQTTPPQSTEECLSFVKYLEEMKALITCVSVEGSLVISVECDFLENLDGLVRRLLIWHS